MEASQVIRMLNLSPLEGEGGFYRETYRSHEMIGASSLPHRYTDAKSISTCIYYLITRDSFSCLHRLKSDEIYHFYSGDPVQLLLLEPAKGAKIITLGNRLDQNQIPQYIVPHGCWQGLTILGEGEWALLGTTMSPGFESADFESADRDMLILEYPEWESHINRLTPAYSLNTDFRHKDLIAS